MTSLENFDLDLHDWKARAACRGHDPDLWYPTAKHEGERAKSICAICPVRIACLTHSIATREAHGIWGGIDEWDRARLMRRRRRRK